ncbi:MAG: type III-B CRISPR-associated protein Cas10/Cmr2 [Desulfurococcales archaeon]|nr:type III-B CRISPR-associated protein Cas10/Cmr2 [Desulfurococcales archaeon]
MKPSWYEDFFLWKIGALTHDPPHKAWIIAGLLKDGWKTGLSKKNIEAAEKRKIKHKHELASFAIRAAIFSEDMADYLDGFPKGERETIGNSEEVKGREENTKRVIKKADILASAFDRWQISEFQEKFGTIFDVQEVYLLNPLSGDLIKPEISKDGRIDLIEFEKELSDIWHATNNICLRYHLFYATHEPMFYEKVISLPSPADRRIPTHTVFDHLYACAAIINWLSSDAISKREKLDPKGLLVRIDLAGIQDFISASRKLRDVWFSSWLASALVFKTIEELIKEIGPDILIRPTARHNPFYYNFLLHWLKETEAPKEVQKKLKEIGEKYAGLEEWPRYAVIPATVDLLLPPYNVLSQLLDEKICNDDDLIRYFHERYANCWKNLVDIVLKKGFRRLRLEEGELKKKLEESSEKTYQYGIEKIPPLTMRIITVSVPEDLNPEEGKQEQWYYNYAFRRLGDRFKSIKSLKIHPACFTNLTKITEEMWRNKERYHVCTVCGKFPSVLDIPYREEEYYEVVPPDLRVYFDLGEHLCSYCLIKRLATHPAIFSSIAEKLIDYSAFPLGFSSTSSIATYPFMKGLVEAQDNESVKNIVNEIIKQLRELRIPFITPYWDALGKLQDKAKNEVKKFLGYDAELTLLPEEREARRRAEKLRKAVKESVQDVLDPTFTRTNTYYAIVRGDGDYIGCLLSGHLNQETIDTNYIDLLASSIESIPDEEAKKFARLIRESANNNVRVVKRILRSELGQKMERTPEKKIEEAARRLCELFSEVLKEGRIPVTPAYHTTLSRALMVTALKDIETVQEEARGIVIYAGGDDFLAFVPAVFALNLVFKTRKCYSIGDLVHRGFHRVGNGYFMSLGNASRSYSVIFGHFKYPMSQLLRLSYEFLMLAKNVQVVHRAFRKIKDTLLLAYCPRGGGIKVKSVLPLSHEKSVRLLMSLVSNIEDNLLSHSVVYDLVKEINKYSKETQQLGLFDIIESMLSYLLNRNLVVKEARPAMRLIASELKELADYIILDNEENEEILLYHMVLALWAVIVALRGREL